MINRLQCVKPLKGSYPSEISATFVTLHIITLQYTTLSAAVIQHINTATTHHNTTLPSTVMQHINTATTHHNTTIHNTSSCCNTAHQYSHYTPQHYTTQHFQLLFTVTQHCTAGGGLRCNRIGRCVMWCILGCSKMA